MPTSSWACPVAGHGYPDMPTKTWACHPTRGAWERVLLCSVVLMATLIGGGCGTRPSSPTNQPAVPIADRDIVRPASGGEMVLIPGGTFTMGDAHGRADEHPHEVRLGPYYMDRFPVTQELYQSLMGVNPSKRKHPKNPVERTQWTDAARFCNRCSEREGLSPCYDLQTWTCRFDADGYRLPTEAEWEFACRAGGSGAYTFGDDPASLPRYAWFRANSGGTPRPVGQKSPNRFGLFDMHGNVWQWCNDFYSETYYSESPHDSPTGPTEGKWKVLRGGAWDCPAEKCRAGCRFKEFPVYSDACFGADSYGFRRVRAARKAETAPTVIASQSTSKEETSSSVPAQAPAPKPVTPVSVQGNGRIDPAELKGTIVFVSDRGGTLKIWKMHASGKAPVQLTHDANPDADPRFAPDGKRILYTTLRDGFPEVWLMSREGADPKFVTKGSQGTWSPDGKQILFIRENQAYVRDLDSGRERRVTPDDWERCGVPAWSPDGRRFAVASRHLGEIGIFVLSLDGKENRPLQAEEPCCTPQWSRDGSKLLCQSVQGHILQVDVHNPASEQETFGADVQHDARYSPDGSLILFCRAPTPEGPWQICVKALDGDDSDFVALTTEGSNLLPDWHPDE